MATNNTLRQYISQQVSHSMNIKDPTPNSKITNLVETIINELDNFEEFANRTVDNMFIESCNSEYLDKAGSQEGLSRSRTRSFKIGKNTNLIGIKNLTGKVLNSKYLKNTSIQLDENLWITFLEDIDLSNISDSIVPIFVELKTNDLQTNTLSIIKGSSYLTSIDNVYIEFLEEISIPLIEETESEFRARVLFSKGTSNYGSESAIKSCIATSSYVDSYSMDYETTPPTIYIFNAGMLLQDDFDANLEVYAKPVISSNLNLRKADGTSYSVELPTPVSFKINIQARITNPRPVSSEFFSFVEYIIKTFRIGEEYTINEDSIRKHLSSLFIDLNFLDDYNITFLRTYLNFEYAAENNSITIYKNEYPFLESTNTVQ